MAQKVTKKVTKRQQREKGTRAGPPLQGAPESAILAVSNSAR